MVGVNGYDFLWYKFDVFAILGGLLVIITKHTDDQVGLTVAYELISSVMWWDASALTMANCWSSMYIVNDDDDVDNILFINSNVWPINVSNT